jgi:excisionase family DNA binding protein
VNNEQEARTTRVTPPRLYLMSEVAEMLRVSPKWVLHLVETGRLRSVRIGERGWRRIPVEDVERLIQEGIEESR